MKIKLIELLKQKKVFIPASAVILIILLNIMNPLYAEKYGNNNSPYIINLDNLDFNWIPDFKIPQITIKNPFEESEEIKKISGILEKSSKFKYVKGVNSSASRLPTVGGDCWAMSDWLYKNIKKTGVECRIIQYETPLAKNHRSVQIKSNDEWVDLPYGRYRFDSRFAAARSKPEMFVYKGG